MAERRISGAIGQELDLNITFFRNGQPAAPFAVRRIDIYKGSVAEENKVAEIDLPLPTDSSYDSILVQSDVNSDGIISNGEYVVRWQVPADFDPGMYFDVWNFLPDDPILSSGTEADLDDETLWLKCCNRFWLYSDGWYCWDGLETIRVNFEQLDIKFRKPEIRYIEVGIMPLPLYDFNQNLIMPAIPRSTATISIDTINCEAIVTDAPMTIRLRQGSYKTNPFVLSYQIDTSNFLVGTYKARVKLTLPEGSVHVSPDMFITIH